MFRKKFLFISLVSFSCTALAQLPRSFTAVAPKSQQQALPEDNKLYMSPAVPAEFPGGDAGLKKYLDEHLDRRVPTTKKAPAGQYIVMVKCIVSIAGTVSDVTPESHFGYGMEEEVARALKTSPRWVPARHNGRPVNAIRKLSVTFSVPVQ